MQDRHAMPRVCNQMMTCKTVEVSDKNISNISMQLQIIMQNSFQGTMNFKQEASSIFLLAVTLTLLVLIYSKPKKIASGNNMGDMLHREKTVQSILARIKGPVLRPV